MDENFVQTFHTQSYEKAKEIRRLTLAQRAIILLPLLPSLILKALIVTVLALFYLLLPIVQLFLPKRLIDIRGHLAVVSAKIKSFKICIDI